MNFTYYTVQVIAIPEYRAFLTILLNLSIKRVHELGTTNLIQRALLRSPLQL